MTLNEYQEAAKRTINNALTPDEIELHALHGLSAEVGEIHSIYQKRYQGHDFCELELKKEIGDALWNMNELITINGWSFEEIAQMNIDKLKKRYPDGFQAERSINRPEYLERKESGLTDE